MSLPLHTILKDGSTLRVDHAYPDQAEAFAAFGRRVAAQSEMMRTEADEYAPPERMALFLEKSLADGLNLNLAAWRGEAIAGNLSLHRTHHRRTLHAAMLGMMVDEAHKGLGVGQHLLKAGIDWARASGLRKIDLHVRQDNPAALALYEKFGFEKEGIMRRGLRTGAVLHDVFYMGLLID